MKSILSTLSKLTIVLALVSITALTTGCPKKQTVDDGMAADADTATGDSDSGNALGLMTISFPYDSYVLTADAKQKLKDNVAILKDRSSVQVQIEGHCDERGSIQYNLALGEKRANAVRNWLIDAGIEGGRVTTISFGEERPLDTGHTDAAWARNRRANFVITSR